MGREAFQGGEVSLVSRAPNNKGSLCSQTVPVPTLPRSHISLKARSPTCLTAKTISNCQQPSYIWCPSLWSTTPAILSLYCGPIGVVIWFIFKCQWSSLSLGTRNSGHSAAVLHMAGAGRWELHLPGSFAIKIVLDSTHEQATQDLRSGRKPENIASLAPAGCKILQQLPGVPSNAVIFSRSSLQFLRLPGSPNFSGKPEHKWQCSLTLVPLALQEFWKHLNEISYFLRDVWMLPSDPQIVKANIDQTPPRCEQCEAFYLYYATRWDSYETIIAPIFAVSRLTEKIRGRAETYTHPYSKVRTHLNALLKLLPKFSMHWSFSMSPQNADDARESLETRHLK